MDSGIARGEVNCIGMTVIEFLSLKSRKLIDPALVSYKNDFPFDTMLLLVNKESPYKNLRDLKEKNIIIERGRKAIVPLYWLDTELLKAGLPARERFFGSVKLEDNSRKAAIPLYFKQIDACVISRNSYKTMTEMNPQFGRNLLILLESAPLVIDMVGMSTRFNGQERRDFIDVATKLASEEEGKQILMLFHYDALIPFRQDYLKGVEELKNIHDRLLKKTERRR